MEQLIFNLGALLLLIGVATTACYFSPLGFQSLLTWRFWSLVIGTVLPGMISIVFAFRSEDTALALGMAILFILTLFGLSFLVSLFLQTPKDPGYRLALGFGVSLAILLVGVILKW